MIKVNIIEKYSKYELARAINDFASEHKIVNVSISANKDSYCACVMYEKEGGIE